MPHIIDREGDNAKRRNRIAGFKRGPGVFVYDGSLEDTVWEPTAKLTEANEPLIDADGMPVVVNGVLQTKVAGKAQFTRDGRVLMGGPPKVTRKPIEVMTVRKIKFPAGEPVEVQDPSLALKLRGMPGFTEVEAIEVKEADGEELPPDGSEAPKKRGRKPKAVTEVEATGAED